MNEIYCQPPAFQRAEILLLMGLRHQGQWADRIEDAHKMDDERLSTPRKKAFEYAPQTSTATAGKDHRRGLHERPFTKNSVPQGT